MIALITGASSGMGKDFALKLAKMGYDIIGVSRDGKRLDELKKDINTNFEAIELDLSAEQNCLKLYELVKDKDIEILINNAGFGVFGKFDETDLKKELNLIDVNIKAVHILTKLFLKDFKAKNKGKILNVASLASFCPGPLMATYYASKAYVYRLTRAIHAELKKDKSSVYMGVFCPGPVATNFNNVAGVKFAVKQLSSEYATMYALKKMFKGRSVIVPGLTFKMAHVLSKLLPDGLVAKVSGSIQNRKIK